MAILSVPKCFPISWAYELLNTSSFIDLLQFNLTHNYFLFESKIFHQLRGTAMGSPCAPTYANLFPGCWGLMSSVRTTQNGCHTSFFWVRFIDDIFILWGGPEGSFQEFVSSLNVNDVGLKFTYEINDHSISFLDIRIEKDRQGYLQTKVFRKPTSTNNLLRWESHHPVAL